MLLRVSLFLFAVGFFLLQGCVAVQTFPAVARKGDTITLALGSVDGLDKSKLQISYVPQSTGIAIDITANIRSVLKVYPDRTSPASMSGDYMAFLTIFGGHAAWMNIAVIDLPLTLPTGSGYFQVDFAASVRQPNTTQIQSAEAVQITTEILAASGAPGDFSYHANPGNIIAGDFTELQSIPHVVLRSSSRPNYNSSSYPAAAEYRIKLPITGDVATLDNSQVHVVWDYKPGEDNMQIQLNWRRDGDVMTVNVLVPTEQTLAESLFNFSIVVNPRDGGHIIDINGTPQLLSYRYYNFNGNEITAQRVPEVVVMQ